APDRARVVPREDQGVDDARLISAAVSPALEGYPGARVAVREPAGRGKEEGVRIVVHEDEETAPRRPWQRLSARGTRPDRRSRRGPPRARRGARRRRGGSGGDRR